MRTIPSCFALAGLLATALTGCMPAQPAMQQYPTGAAYASPGMGAQCPGLLASARDSMCRPRKTGSVHASADFSKVDGVWAQSRASFKSMCADPASEAELVKMDGCLETARAAVKVEQAEQATRLPAERKRLAEVSADAKFDGARRTYRDKVAALRDAEEEVSVAQRSGQDCSTTRTRGITPPSCDRYRMLQGRASRGEEALERARTEVGAILETHKIDPRDAEELGLLP